MKRWKRLLITSVVALLLGLVLVGALIYRQTQAVPQWYTLLKDPARIDAAAARAEDKLIESRNWAASVAAFEARAERANTQPVRVQEFATKVTDEELNAFFMKWARLQGWDQKIASYVTDPIVATHDGAIVVAGKVQSLGGMLLSMHFRPTLKGDQLQVELVRVTGGNLDLPTSQALAQLDRLKPPLAEAVSHWQKEGAVDAKGQANAPLQLAAAGQLAMGVLTHEPVEAVAFMPVDDRRSVPVRLTKIAVVEGGIELGAKPVALGERNAVVERLKTARKP